MVMVMVMEEADSFLDLPPDLEQERMRDLDLELGPDPDLGVGRNLDLGPDLVRFPTIEIKKGIGIGIVVGTMEGVIVGGICGHSHGRVHGQIRSIGQGQSQEGRYLGEGVEIMGKINVKTPTVTEIETEVEDHYMKDVQVAEIEMLFVAEAVLELAVELAVAVITVVGPWVVIEEYRLGGIRVEGEVRDPCLDQGQGQGQGQGLDAQDRGLGSSQGP